MSDVQVQLSPEVGEKFLACFANLTGLYEAFLRDGSADASARDGDARARFNAIRTAMTADAAFLSRTHDYSLTDEQFRTLLHQLLDLAIADFQFNERFHMSKGD